MEYPARTEGALGCVNRARKASRPHDLRPHDRLALEYQVCDGLAGSLPQDDLGS